MTSVSVTGPSPLNIMSALCVSMVAGWAVAGDSAVAIVSTLGIVLLMLIVSDRLLLILALTLFTVAAANSSSAQLNAAAFYARFVMYAVLVVAVLTRSRRLRCPPAPLSIVLGLLILLALASALWSSDSILSLQRAIGFALLITAAMMFGANSSQRQIMAMLMVLGAVTSVVLSVGLFLALVGSDFAYAPASNRLRGVLVNTNSVGLAVAISAPLVIVFLSRARGVVRVLWGGALIVMAISLAFSQSRGGLLATAVGLLVFLWKGSGNRWKPLTAVFLIGIAAAALFLIAPTLRPAPVGEALTRITEGQEGSAGSGRLVAWSLALDAWAERPLSGWGFGTSEAVFGPRAIAIEDIFVGTSPHNVFLQVLLELGPIGLCLTLMALALMASALMGPRASRLGAGVWGSLAAAVATQFTEGGFISAGSLAAFLFWFIAGAAVQLRPSEDGVMLDR